jgi:hypothetical protein
MNAIPIDGIWPPERKGAAFIPLYREKREGRAPDHEQRKNDILKI